MICVSNGRLRSRGIFSFISRGLRHERPLVRAGPRVHAVRGAFVSCCSAQLVRLRVQQAVERLFDARPHHLVQVPSQLLFADSKIDVGPIEQWPTRLPTPSATTPHHTGDKGRTLRRISATRRTDRTLFNHRERDVGCNQVL
jgi:hypothetical protein